MNGAYLILFTVALASCCVCYANIELRGTSTPFNRTAVEELKALLFPNRTGPGYAVLDPLNPKRELEIYKVPYNKNNPVPCVTCQALSTCSILNGFLIEEVYYPNNPSFRETCNVIESFGTRISKEIFGNGRTFRDTPQCRGNNRSVCVFQNIIF